MKPFLILLSVALLAVTVPAGAWAAPQEEPGYAEREAQAPGLENFTGGIHELIIAIIFIAVVATVVYFVFFHHVHHHGCGHPHTVQP